MASFGKTQCPPPPLKSSLSCPTPNTRSASWLSTVEAKVSRLFLWLQRQVWFICFNSGENSTLGCFANKYYTHSVSNTEYSSRHSPCPAEVTWSASLSHSRDTKYCESVYTHITLSQIQFQWLNKCRFVLSNKHLIRTPQGPCCIVSNCTWQLYIRNNEMTPSCHCHITSPLPSQGTECDPSEPKKLATYRKCNSNSFLYNKVLLIIIYIYITFSKDRKHTFSHMLGGDS